MLCVLCGVFCVCTTFIVLCVICVRDVSCNCCVLRVCVFV